MRPNSQSPLSADEGRALLKEMLRIRRLEEASAKLYSEGHIHGFLHLYIGEEAIAAGIVPLLSPDDALLGTYREHGHALVRGMSARSIMAEMLGKVSGCCRGRGGSMHLFSAEHRFYGGHAIVAGGLPVAVGLAMAEKMQGKGGIVACFFGEGAVAEGEFHEAMNLAALWKLPVLFCCENNGYAMGTALSRSESEVELTTKARSYGMRAKTVDGMDVLVVKDAATQAIDAMREDGLPYFLELKTYRFRPHSMFDAELYREKQEVALWRTRDPIRRFTAALKELSLLDDDAFAQIEGDVAAEVEDAVAFALAAELEPVEALTRFVYSEGGAR